MALAALVGAVSGMVLGPYHRCRARRARRLAALAALAALIVVRAMSYGNAPLAVIANACGALVVCLYIPTIRTAVYNQAKRSPCPLRFHIATEAGWDMGGASALLIAAGLLAAGVPIGAGILLSLLGAMASFLLLRRYFAVPAPAAEPVVPSALAER